MSKVSYYTEDGLKKLREGEHITFEVEDTDRGSTAINLQKLS